MTKCALIAFTYVLVILVGCAGRVDNDESDPIPECQAYLAAERNCLSAISPEVARERTKSTRAAFTMVARDPVGRNQLAAQCRAAEQQISRTCR